MDSIFVSTKTISHTKLSFLCKFEIYISNQVDIVLCTAIKFGSGLLTSLLISYFIILKYQYFSITIIINKNTFYFRSSLKLKVSNLKFLLI